MAIGIVLFVIFRESDEAEIKKNIREIKTLLDKQGEEPPLIALSKAKKIGAFFVDDCRVSLEAPVPDISGKLELVAIVQQARNSVVEVEVSFRDISIEFSDNKGKAALTMTAAANFQKAGSSRREFEALEVECIWVKPGDSWKISEVRSIETLR